MFISELTRIEIEETPDEELRDKMKGANATISVSAIAERKGLRKDQVLEAVSENTKRLYQYTVFSDPSIYHYGYLYYYKIWERSHNEILIFNI